MAHLRIAGGKDCQVREAGPAVGERAIFFRLGVPVRM